MRNNHTKKNVHGVKKHRQKKTSSSQGCNPKRLHEVIEEIIQKIITTLKEETHVSR